MNQRRPAWLLIVIILLTLPLFAFPTLLGMIKPGDQTAQSMVWLYLIYVPLTDYLAWICWPQRRTIAWVLLALLLMSHCAIWSLVLFEH